MREELRENSLLLADSGSNKVEDEDKFVVEVLVEVRHFSLLPNIRKFCNDTLLTDTLPWGPSARSGCSGEALFLASPVDTFSTRGGQRQSS